MANSHTLWDRLQPQDVMSRHRGAKLRRRYELLGGISLLSPEYLLSVERWPFHTEPPDHYDLTFAPARLVGLAVKHAFAIAHLGRCPTVPRNLRTPPLPFGRRPPQSNCPPCTVPDPDHGPRLEPQRHQGGISLVGSPEPGVPASKPPTYPTQVRQSPMQSCSKGSWGLSV